MFASENEFRHGKEFPSLTVNYNAVLFHQPLGEENEARLFNNIFIFHLKRHFSSWSKRYVLKVFLDSLSYRLVGSKDCLKTQIKEEKDLAYI
ncbi:hypothetical protein BpHYR1_046830 [Brachionus plicatilis]|uniref:Uncharacterized protein n=1 Tax=Brachionus plicatilis TaxID=10195 RepID=A0A3M7S0U1_BRAPC|nr:hypothetical protein BpHYR1_046830 [Brachionus plicatilis]